MHNVASPPVIFRDMKSANILLDDDFNPKLSDFGLAKLGPIGDRTHVSTTVMGTYGYCAPDYAMSGKLTLKSDVDSFGVLLLELITGRRAFDPSRARAERNLTIWVCHVTSLYSDLLCILFLVGMSIQFMVPSMYLHCSKNMLVLQYMLASLRLPLVGMLTKSNSLFHLNFELLLMTYLPMSFFQFHPFLNDRRKFSQLVDPSLEGRYPPRAFHQLVVIASMCLQEQAHVRPIIADVVFALDHVASQPYVQGSDSKIIKSSPSPS